MTRPQPTASTELVFILDRSGSMAGLEDDTIGGFNSMLKKQQAQEGAARVTTVLFDDQYQLLHDRLDLFTVGPITEEEYYVRGTTALLDAIGRTIHKVDAVQKSTSKQHRADKVLFVIITDGMENASHRFDSRQIANLVSKRQEQGWEFLFLGANMDAIAVAQSFGMREDRAVTYLADAQGVAMNFDAVDQVTSKLRMNQPVPTGWADAIRQRKK